MNNNQTAVLILSAGKGKRMNNPNLPKVLAPLDGKPLMWYVVKTAKNLNADRIIGIVGHHKDMVIEYINSEFNSIEFVEQKEQLGTGHAVDQASELLSGFQGNVLILCGDVPLLTAGTLQSFILNHETNSADLSVLSAETENPFGYGRIVRDSEGNFQKITEEKDADEEIRKVKEINSGVYFVKSELLFDALKNVSNNNAQGEYYLTDVVEILKRQSKKVIAYRGAKFEELQGVNSPEQLKEIEDYYFANREALVF